MSKQKYRTEEFIEKSLTLTVGETSQLLGISVPLVWGMIKRGELPTIRLGRLVRIPRARLMAIVNGETEPKQG